MCGIVGFLSFNPSNVMLSKIVLAAMTDSLAHRGPDGWGYMTCNPYQETPFLNQQQSLDFLPEFSSLAFGHRRLKIIDLSEKGQQPMVDNQRQCAIVYNGEVYNYIELREELIALGHEFHSTSDTEVVLHSYREWGINCFARFNGMWSLAIYDLHKRQLILSRDRFGKKPLYYFKSGDFIIFASEIKALLRFPKFSREPNYRKILNYAGRHYRWVDNDNETFFEDIWQIPKSSYVVVGHGGKVTTSRYWQLTDNSNDTDHFSELDLITQYHDLFRNAVEIRLRSDVPVGTMLSGGMDSTAITSIAAEKNPDITAFSGVTGDGYYDETEYIEAVIKKSGIRSVLIRPQPNDLFDTLREMLRFHDEPVCTVTWYSLYLITKAIAVNHIPVILTGHGGDELLAGYWDHYHYYFSDLRCQSNDDSLEHQTWLTNHRRDPEEYLRERMYIDRLHQDTTVEIKKYSNYLSALSPELLLHDHNPNITVSFTGDLSRRLALELLYETVPPVLRAEDRNTMAHAIEARVPFLDYRLVEFCFRLDNSYKIRNGLGKWIARQAMTGILPEKVRIRKDKVGHNAPADVWFRNENRREIEGMIESQSPVNGLIYDRSRVKALFKEHLAGANHYMFFWQYINLNLWFNANFN